MAARVPENEKEQKSFARMQIVMIDTGNLNKEIVLNYKSPIYQNKRKICRLEIRRLWGIM